MAKKRIPTIKKRTLSNRVKTSKNKGSKRKAPSKSEEDIIEEGDEKTFHIGKKSISEVLRMVGRGKYGNDKAQIRRLTKGERANTLAILIDIQYKWALNAFEEFFGDNVSYQEIEQESYVEFKEVMFELINRSIKFRKYGRIGPILTVKADMTSEELDVFKAILDKDGIKLLHSWIVSSVTIITDHLPDSYGKNPKSKETDDSNEGEEDEDFTENEDI